MKIEVQQLDPTLPIPAYAHDGDAGMDLRSAEDVRLEPGQRVAVRTGLVVAIPDGYAGFVHARSGRALKEGLGLPNAPGLIDAGFRGELKVLLVNLDPRDPIEIAHGDKIAQLVIQRVERAELAIVEALEDTARGAGGFGSTGVR